MVYAVCIWIASIHFDLGFSFLFPGYDRIWQKMVNEKIGISSIGIVVPNVFLKNESPKISTKRHIRIISVFYTNIVFVTFYTILYIRC